MLALDMHEELPKDGVTRKGRSKCNGGWTNKEREMESAMRRRGRMYCMA